MNLGAQTITRKRSTGTATAGHGNTVPDWTEPDAKPIPGCSVQPGGGSEFADRREAITTLYTVWAPISADVLDSDRVEFAGTDYEIDGAIERWEVGTPLDHLVIRLKNVAG
ncbi:hypothetical protein [Terrabacter terrigena]|uniref:Head-tail adaptor protein n=1 Tax=Terrabacter terrigena TaxID=574718 RepID=A0ABW3MZP9_9MICO